MKRIQEYVGNDTFIVTYGNGLADVNILKLLDFHKKHKKIATVTAIVPGGEIRSHHHQRRIPGHFFQRENGQQEQDQRRIFVPEPGIFDYLSNGDETVLEKAPLEDLAKDGELKAYFHDGFWKPMDTLKTKPLRRVSGRAAMLRGKCGIKKK